jgi:hypothetical protein
MNPTPVSNYTSQRRAGITLMEVLISIGILSIGLASVVALIPAGGSQAKKAIIEDRRGAMGAGAMADVINFGMLNPETWNAIPTAPYRVVIDPIGNGSFPSAVGLTAISVSNMSPGSAVANLVFLAADDLVYRDDPSKADPAAEPPVPKLTTDSARRLAEGDYSWLATLTPAGGASGPQYYTLSIVQFHRRPPASVALSVVVTGVYGGQSSVTLNTASLGLAPDDVRRLFPNGGVVLCTDKATTHAWRRIQLAAPTVVNEIVTSLDIVLDRATPAGVTDIYAFEGTVGVIDRGVQLEGTSQWTQ